MGRYKKRYSESYSSVRSHSFLPSQKQKSNKRIRQNSEMGRLLSRTKGPITPLDPDSPSPEIESKIQDTLAKKGKPKYDKEIGLQTVQLSMVEALQFMPESKRDILRSNESLKHVLINSVKLEEAIKEDEKRIQDKIQEANMEQKKYEAELASHKTLKDLKREGWSWQSYEAYEQNIKALIQHRKDDATSYMKLLDMYSKDRSATLDYILEGNGQVRIRNRGTTLDQARKDGYVVVYPKELENPFMDKYVTVQKPTKSGGLGVFVGPYHFKDSKTGEEVRLWEWGIDYDVG